jgi:hypothetical protein
MLGTGGVDPPEHPTTINGSRSKLNRNWNFMVNGFKSKG